MCTQHSTTIQHHHYMPSHQTTPPTIPNADAVDAVGIGKRGILPPTTTHGTHVHVCGLSRPCETLLLTILHPAAWLPGVGVLLLGVVGLRGGLDGCGRGAAALGDALVAEGTHSVGWMWMCEGICEVMYVQYVCNMCTACSTPHTAQYTPNRPPTHTITKHILQACRSRVACLDRVGTEGSAAITIHNEPLLLLDLGRR